MTDWTHQSLDKLQKGLHKSGMLLWWAKMAFAKDDLERIEVANTMKAMLQEVIGEVMETWNELKSVLDV